MVLGTVKYLYLAPRQGFDGRQLHLFENLYRKQRVRFITIQTRLMC